MLEQLLSQRGYGFLRPILFKFEPELAHGLAMFGLKLAKGLIKPQLGGEPRQMMGLQIPHCAGLAAGFDKNGDYIDLLFNLGFAFVELGTVTPRAQAGNPRPRVFRLPAHKAIVNSMGFPNRGAAYLRQRILRRRSRGIIGVNIGKNRSTPLAASHRDYCQVLAQLYDVADYFVINISSPNTPDLRSLQGDGYFGDLVGELSAQACMLSDKFGVRRPIAYKISPDMDTDTLRRLLDVAVAKQVDGIVASNTSTQHAYPAPASLPGGISGAALCERAEAQLLCIRKHLGDALAVISVGGIMDVASGQRRLAAGAEALQLYSGFVYNGPQLVHDLAKLPGHASSTG